MANNHLLQVPIGKVFLTHKNYDRLRFKFTTGSRVGGQCNYHSKYSSRVIDNTN